MKLKANRRALLACCRLQTEQAAPVSLVETTERRRGRLERRLVEVYAAPAVVPPGWPRLGAVLRVVRSGERGRRSYERTSYYVTSHEARAGCAPSLAALVRQHWSVENGLHWSKDAEQREDVGRMRDLAGASVLSLLRGLVVSLTHRAGLPSQTSARSLFANRVDRMMPLLRT